MSYLHPALGATASLAFSLSLGCQPPAYPREEEVRVAFSGQSIPASVEIPGKLGPDEIWINYDCKAFSIETLTQEGGSRAPYLKIRHGSSHPMAVRLYDERNVLSGTFQALPGRQLDVYLRRGDFSGWLKPDSYGITVYFSQDGREVSTKLDLNFHEGPEFPPARFNCLCRVMRLP